MRRLRQPLHHVRARGDQRDRPQARRPPRAIRQPEAPGRARAGRQQAARESGAAGGTVGVDRGGGEAERSGGRGGPDRRPRGARPRRARPGLGDPVRVRVPQPGDLDELEAVVRRYKEDPLPGADQLALEGDSGPSGPRAVSVFPPWGRQDESLTRGEVMSDSRNATAPAVTAAGDGVSVGRRFTEPGVSPFDAIEWEIRDAVIGDPENPAFEQRGVEFPKSWSQNATNIVAQKYFRGRMDSPERESSRQADDRPRGRHDRDLGPRRRLLRHATTTLSPSRTSSPTSFFTRWRRSTRRSGSTWASRSTRSAAPASSSRSRTRSSRSSTGTPRRA